MEVAVWLTHVIFIPFGAAILILFAATMSDSSDFFEIVHFLHDEISALLVSALFVVAFVIFVVKFPEVDQSHILFGLFSGNNA